MSERAIGFGAVCIHMQGFWHSSCMIICGYTLFTRIRVGITKSKEEWRSVLVTGRGRQLSPLDLDIGHRLANVLDLLIDGSEVA